MKYNCLHCNSGYEEYQTNCSNCGAPLKKNLPEEKKPDKKVETATVGYDAKGDFYFIDGYKGKNGVCRGLISGFDYIFADGVIFSMGEIQIDAGSSVEITYVE